VPAGGAGESCESRRLKVESGSLMVPQLSSRGVQELATSSRRSDNSALPCWPK